jgi:hypothetical protein
MRRYASIKKCRIVEARIHIFLISVLDKGEHAMFVYLLETKEKRSPQGCETSRLPHFLENRLTIPGTYLC